MSGLDATAGVKDPSPEAQQGGDLGDNATEAEHSGVEIATGEAGAGAREETDGKQSDDSEVRVLTDGEVETMKGTARTSAREEGDGEKLTDSDVQVLTDGEVETMKGVPQTGAGVGNGPATGDLPRTGEESDDPEEAIRKSLAELQNVCNVLAIDYEGKLLEFGIKIEKERVDDAVKFLKKTMISNFKKLQTTAKELLEAWKTADIPVTRMSTFAWVLTVRDADGPDSVTGKGYLATSCLRNAEKEVLAIRNEMLSKIRGQYIAQRKKLIRILSESHLVAADVDFDPSEAVDPAHYKMEKQRMKACIWEVKKLVPERKELILRVELVQKAVKKKRSLPFCEALIGDARKTVQAMKKISEAEVLFDGLNVDGVLDGLEEASNALESARQASNALQSARQEQVTSEQAVASKTRSGRVIPAPSN